MYVCIYVSTIFKRMHGLCLSLARTCVERKESLVWHMKQKHEMVHEKGTAMIHSVHSIDSNSKTPLLTAKGYN